MRPLTTIASLLTLTHSSLARHVTINNFCSFPVYLWTVGDSASAMTTLASHASISRQGRPGSPHTNGVSHTFTAPYQMRLGGSGGISIKLSRTPGLGAPGAKVTQLEYTAEPGQPLWYDLSNIDGNAFADSHIVLSPLAEWQQSCTAVDCPVGEVCQSAYTHTTDNWATHSCPEGTELRLDLCVAR